MKERIQKYTTLSCWLLFLIVIVVHAFEAIVLRMDETIFAENFINKLFGILCLWIVLRISQWKWKDIGFSTAHIVKNIGLGFLLSFVVFSVSYSIETIILMSQGKTVEFGFFTMGFSLTNEAEIQTGIGFILMCVFFNIVNVVMEEGTFRGLFYNILKTDHSAKHAAFMQALLFGIWHVVTPLHNLIDGDIGIGAFVGLSIGYVILAGIMGIKWALMYAMTGSLYAGMADHFFNNCIATNLLHLSTETGTDEMMIIRILIAQILSFVVITVIWKKRQSRSAKEFV